MGLPSRRGCRHHAERENANVARAFVTIAAGLGSWERHRWARLWLLYVSGWTLLVDASMIHMYGFSPWWRSAGNLGIFGWLGGAAPVSRDVVAAGTLVIFFLPDVRREFRASGRWELIAIRVVIACDLTFYPPRLWQNSVSGTWSPIRVPNLAAETSAVPPEAPRLRPGRLTRPVLFAENGARWTSG